MKEISGDTRKRIADYCRKISVAHNLDPEIQRELASHMEDKILGYLSGEEQLGESDAFILTREHFGDPAAIKALFGGVHAGEAAASLGRRMLALALMFNVFSFLAFVVQRGVYGLIHYLVPGSSTILFLKLYFHPLFMIGLAALLFWMLCIILKHWKAQADRGHIPWILRQPVLKSGLLVFATFLLRPVFWMLLNVFIAVPPGSNVELPGAFKILSLAALVVVIMGATMLWLWWCDSEPRTPNLIGRAMGGFMAFIVLGQLLSDLISMEPSGVAPSRHWILVQTQGWRYVFSPPRLSSIPSYLIAFGVVLVLSFLGRKLYEAVRKRLHSHKMDGDDSIVS